ncbi:MAG: hypothetical protein ACRDTC_22680 [Pseudonocardiaceae bacterium]
MGSARIASLIPLWRVAPVAIACSTARVFARLGFGGQDQLTFGQQPGAWLAGQRTQVRGQRCRLVPPAQIHRDTTDDAVHHRLHVAHRRAAQRDSQPGLPLPAVQEGPQQVR